MTEPSNRSAAAHTGKIRWKMWLSRAVVVASLVWIAFLLKDAWREISSDLWRLDKSWIAAGLAVGLAATWAGFCVFAQIFEGMSPLRMRSPQLGHLYFTSQLLKHLPGRFFGVAYQIASSSKQVTAVTWISANSVHMTLTMYTACLSSAMVLIFPHSIVGAVLVLALGASLYYAFWRDRWARALERVASRHDNKLARGLAGVARTVQGFNGCTKTRILCIMLLSWALYFAAWAAYGSAHPDLDATSGLRLCALYNVAWIAGYLSLVTPSGAGVRELVFVAIASSFPASGIAYGIIIGRVSLLAIDLLMGLLYSPFPTEKQ